MRVFTAVVATIAFLAALPFGAQKVGDRVALVTRSVGIPGHPEPGDNAVSLRIPGEAVVEVTGRDRATGWLEVTDDAGNSAWITRRYIASVVGASEIPPGLCYRVGTWNLEHFKFRKTSGFPENRSSGGPTYLPRTPDEVSEIADAIRTRLDIKLLVLNEINGTESGNQARSEELDALVADLGSSFRYDVASSGGAQRNAFVYDTRFVQRNGVTEIEIPRKKVQGKDIFARDPLVGHFAFRYRGEPQNDLLVVGLHLASGQRKTRNHDEAMGSATAANGGSTLSDSMVCDDGGFRQVRLN